MSTTGIQTGFFGWVMKIGNKLPNPFFLFVTLTILTLLISMLLNFFEVQVHANLLDKTTGKLVNQIVTVKNLLSLDYLHFILKDFTKIYIGFAPLGLVMVTMIGIGYVQKSGFFDVAMKKAIDYAPIQLITFIIVLVSILSTIASNAGIIISTTLAASIFASMKRNPILGAVVGYAAAHGGEPCNFVITGFMVLLSGITGTATEAAGIHETINPLINYYFFAPMVIIMALVLTFVTEKIMPKLMDVTWEPQQIQIERRTEGFSGIVLHNRDVRNLSNSLFDYLSERGLKWAGIGTLLYASVILLGCIPSDGFLRNSDFQLLPKSPLIDGVVAILVGWFLVVGTCFGLGYRSIKSQHDVPKFMNSGLQDAANYFVICFPAAFFVKFFGDSNLAIILSVKGGELLSSMNFTGLPLALTFIFLVMFLNMFITSGSAKWMILAPIFVPMFYAVGFTPAMTQLIYAIGDTITDPITPINYYIPIVITIMMKYKKENEPSIGIGNVISMTMPYGITFGIILIGFMCLWYFMGWPIGPDVYMIR